MALAPARQMTLKCKLIIAGRYYPQMIELYGEIDAAWVIAVWKAAPTPAEAAALDASAVSKILKENRIRRIGAEEVLAILKKKPITVAPGVTEAARESVRILCEQIEVVRNHLKETREHVDRLLAILSEPVATEEGEPKQRDAVILKSMPGVGEHVVAALLTEATSAVERRDYQPLRALSATAPVTKRSGKKCVVLRRLACHPRVRTAVYHWANVARMYDETCKAKYQALRARGHNHARSLRSIGDHLLYVACALLKKGVLYDPAYNASKASS